MNKEENLNKCPKCQSDISQIGFIGSEINGVTYTEYCKNIECGFERTIPVKFEYIFIDDSEVS